MSCRLQKKDRRSEKSVLQKSIINISANGYSISSSADNFVLSLSNYEVDNELALLLRNKSFSKFKKIVTKK